MPNGVRKTRVAGPCPGVASVAAASPGGLARGRVRRRMEGLSAVEDFFHLRERGTTVGTEVKAGVTTFMVMVYIVAVNPSILSAAGIDAGAAAAATALT